MLISATLEDFTAQAEDENDQTLAAPKPGTKGDPVGTVDRENPGDKAGDKHATNRRTPKARA